MKHKIYIWLVCFLCVVTAWGQDKAVKDMNGAEWIEYIRKNYDNAELEAFEIYTADQLEAFSYMVTLTEDAKPEEEINGSEVCDFSGKTVKLMADIDLNGSPDNQWTPIGWYYGPNDDKPFKGTFDGGGHTVSGIYINDNNRSYVGLFGYVADGGTVKKVGVEDSYFKSDGYSHYVGSIVGYLYKSTISDCYNTGEVSSEGEYSDVGGVVGYANTSVVSKCYNIGKVSGIYVGGIAGFFQNSTMPGCYNIGKVSSDGTSKKVGCIVGYNQWFQATSTYTDCGFLAGVNGDLKGIGEGGNDENNQNTPAMKAEELAAAMTEAGFEGVEYKDGKLRLPNGSEVDVPEEAKVYATLTITESEGGTVSASPEATNDNKYEHNTVITLTATPNEGYTFEEWKSENITIGEDNTFTMPETDVTVTAIFKKNTYTVTATSNNEAWGTVSVNPENGPYEHGSAVTITATANVGYHFVGWEGSEETSSTITIESLESDITVKAIFEKNTYTVTATSNNDEWGTVTINPESGPYEYGSAVTITATANAGYHFVGWEGSAETNSTITIESLESDITVKAIFAEDDIPEPEPTPDPEPEDPVIPDLPNYYNIYVEDCEGVTVELTKAVVKEGNSTSFTIKVEEEYDATGMEVTVKRSLFGYSEIITPDEDGKYNVSNIWTDIYIVVKGVEKENPTGIEDIDGVKVYTKDGSAYIKTSQLQEVTIINISGTVVKHESQIGMKQYDLPRGIYIIYVGETPFKVRI